MINCKYTIRDHIRSLEDYINIISNYKGIDFYKYTIMINNINSRIKRLKEYLNIPSNPTKVKSINSIIKDNLRFLKD